MHIIIYFIPDAIYFYQDALRITAYNEHRRVWIAKFFHRWALFFVLLCKILCGSWLYVSLETILKKVEILRSEILNDYLRLSENDYRTKSKFLFKSFFSKCPSVSYIFKVNIRNTRARCEICPKLTYFTPCSRVSIVNFGQINVEWVWTNLH